MGGEREKERERERGCLITTRAKDGENEQKK